MLKTTIILLIIFFGTVEAVQNKPSGISESVWKKVHPYLLPDHHPIKKKLDNLFTKNCLLNGLELYKAGFRFNSHKNALKVIVAKHPDLSGYLVKLFLENQPSGTEWSHWIQRIHGANLIRQTIEDKSYTASFKVPNKWIYCLPYKRDIHDGRHFVLIIEDMQLTNSVDNIDHWKNRTTYEQIYMFWDLIETCGLFDSIYIDNAPFCKDGLIAFIDTEHFSKWPINYPRFNKYLKKGKLELWKKLTDQE